MSDGLMVDFATLDQALTAFNEKANEMDADLDLIKTQGDLSAAWTDANGVSFNSSFAQFLTDAKQINADLRTLVTHANEKLNNYKTIESTHAGNMGG